jgi:hypothetical protein
MLPAGQRQLFGDGISADDGFRLQDGDFKSGLGEVSGCD